MAISVVIKTNNLPRMSARLNPLVKEITKAALFQVVALADPMTPVDTSNLKNNKDIGDDYVHWLAPYAAYQDKGTIHIAPKLFATNAAARVQPQFIRALTQIEGQL